MGLKNLSARDILKLEKERLSEIIRPAGFYINKGNYLRSVLEYFENQLSEGLFPEDLRAELVKIRGVGKETADSIALYGFNCKTIPIDSYTIRFFNRYFGTNRSLKDYEILREKLASIFSQINLMEFHALIDEHCKRLCKKSPDCEKCNLKNGCLKNIT